MSALPSSGNIAFTAINVALGRSDRTQLALSDAQVRTLTGIASGQINFRGFYGRSLGVSGAIFELLFGSATLPTADTNSIAVSASATAPTMVNDVIRGYVMSTVGATRNMFTTAGFSLPASYTKMCWVYSQIASQGNGNLISTNNNGNGQHYWWYNGSSQLQAGHSSAGAITSYISDPSGTPQNAWVHFVLTYDNPSTTMRLYRNGVLVATTVNASLSWSGSSLQLGLGTFGGGFMFNGYLDNMRVYNRAITASEVELVYTNESGLVPGLTANYDFRTTASYSGSGSTAVTDITGNGYNLSFNSAPTYNTSPTRVALSATISAMSSAVSIAVASGYSIELLFMYTSNAGNDFKVFSYTANNNGDGIQVQVNSSNQVVLYNNNTSSGVVASGTTLATNTWYHYLVTSGGVVYINATSVSTTGTASALANGNRILTVGDHGRTKSIVGNVAIARFYNSAVTAAQASSLYNAAKSGGAYGLP